MATPVEISVSPDNQTSLLEELEGPTEAPGEDVRIEDERDVALQDFREAFADYGIPEDLAEHALEVSGAEEKTADEREGFVNRILDAKRDLDEDSEARNAGQNDWRTAIDKAAQSEVRAGVQQAAAYWRKERPVIHAQYPELSSREVLTITASADRRAWLVSKIPVVIRDRLGISPEDVYSNRLDRRYQKIIDRRADSLLEMRTRALHTLREVRPDIPLHLLPSKQYRAAETLTRVDQELRSLRPLKKEDYGAAIASAAGREIAPSQTVNSQESVGINASGRASVQQETARETTLSKHEIALQAVRELRSQTPVDGYRSRAAEAMANRLVQQLQEGREPIVLSAKYQGRDQGQANATHRNAVEANVDIIQAVRDRGIRVDTGTASIAFEKKLEAELSEQVERGQTMRALQ